MDQNTIDRENNNYEKCDFYFSELSGELLALLP